MGQATSDGIYTYSGIALENYSSSEELSLVPRYTLRELIYGYSSNKANENGLHTSQLPSNNDFQREYISILYFTIRTVGQLS